MSHAYERLVADRTDPFRPIPKQRTRQEIHKEAVTENILRHLQRNSPSQVQRVPDNKTDKKKKKKKKKRDKKHQRLVDKAQEASARHEDIHPPPGIFPPYRDEEQKPEYSWTPAQYRGE